MPPKARVEQQLLRLFFNTSDIVGNVSVENLTEIVLRSKEVPVIRCDRYGFPHGTMSQLLSYRDGSLEIAKAHRYLLPDGMIGGSGRPDPEMMYCCGVIVYV